MRRDKGILPLQRQFPIQLKCLNLNGWEQYIFFPVPPLIGSLFIYSFIQQKFTKHLLSMRNSSRSWDRALDKTKLRLSWNYILVVGNRPTTQWLYYKMPMAIHSVRKKKAGSLTNLFENTLLLEQRESRALTLQTAWNTSFCSVFPTWMHHLHSNDVRGAQNK